MKRTYLISLVLIGCLAVISSCSSSKNEVLPLENQSEVILGNMPLNDIRSQLKGKWNLLYHKSPWSIDTIYYDNTFVEFIIGSGLTQDSIKWYDNSIIYVDSKLTWVWSPALYVSSTYLINYTCPPAFDPNNLIPFTLSNDTLTLMQNVSDGNYYILKRIN